MDANRRRRRGLIQNITITALSLTAVLLFAQLQMYNLAAPQDSRYLERLMGTLPDDSPTALRDFSAPVRVVITDSYGRYGTLALTTGSAEFSSLGLREALGAVRNVTASTAESFRAALSGTSLYFDFLEPLPLSVLGALIGAEDTALTGSARCLLLSAGAGDTVRLYLWDGAEGFFSGAVPRSSLSSDMLADRVSQSGFGSVSFAADNAEADALYGRLFPLSVLPAELPDLPVLSAAVPAVDADRLLPVFGFNANTRERYQESDGTEVITEVETDRSLHIRPDGEIAYRAGAESPIEITAEAEAPTEREAVLGAWQLLWQLTGTASGEAQLYLSGVRTGAGTTQLRFEYQIGGTPIRFSDGVPAAEVTLTGASITEVTVRLRQYAASGESALLLPLRQALAIAAEHPGSELSVGYADGGGSTVPAGWLAD